ncbi:MAG: cysteine--tRNA ligase [Candidatus Nealsonbacteria bacterium]|nr:cysteine--tRNA ligase [Candidatus Nealsonbacteria bacterium]
MIKLYNTLTRKEEVFEPIKKDEVTLYSCGPTVYWYAHIGNLRAYIFVDILKKTLEYNEYKVKHVINITDVGHLTSDEDTGEDKLEKGAKRENKTVWEVAEYYTKAFQTNLKQLNIKDPSIWTKVTDYIPEQIDIIKKLEEKGFTYIIEDGVYFDTSKLNNYGKLWGSDKVELKAGARVEMVDGKKNITDFALWKFSPKNEKRQMEWESPWGIGFPGWHTECVAMAAKELGVPIDIHTGGIDHIQIHHTNELAQSDAIYNKELANFWLHNEFLILKTKKMSKSKGEILRVETLIEKNINPLAYRYLCLGAHYRSELAFSWESIENAQNSLYSLYSKVKNLDQREGFSTEKIDQYKKEFLDSINHDLDTPKALALLWKILKSSELNDNEKYVLALEFDKIFGLKLDQLEKDEEAPEEIKKLSKKREKYRKNKDWQKADEVREEIEKLGYIVEDAGSDAIIKKRPR